MTQQQTAGPPSAGHADLAEEFLDRQTPLSRIRNILHRYPAVSPALVLLIAVVVFGLLNDRFLRVENLSLITQQVSVVGTLAIAQTLIILTAGIDLSVGAVMILSSMVMAQLAVNNGVPAPIALLAGLIVGLAAGALASAVNNVAIIVSRTIVVPSLVGPSSGSNHSDDRAGP